MEQLGKFYVLITKLNSDGMERSDDHEARTYAHRSKYYTSRKEADEKAMQYLREGKASQYWILETVALMRKKQEFECLEL